MASRRFSGFTPALILSVAAAAGILAACESSKAYSAPSAAAPSSLTVRTPSGGNSASQEQTLLAAIRASTAKYHNIEAAFADGYIDDGFGCIDSTSFGLDPSLGGMGFHLINWALHDDPATDPQRPDLLVYEPARANGKPKLVALEYEVFRRDWWAAGNTAPPSLLGHEFESLDFPDFEIFALHLWLWRDNPSGMFVDFNPKTSCH